MPRQRPYLFRRRVKRETKRLHHPTLRHLNLTHHTAPTPTPAATTPRSRTGRRRPTPPGSRHRSTGHHRQQLLITHRTAVGIPLLRAVRCRRARRRPLPSAPRYVRTGCRARFGSPCRRPAAGDEHLPVPGGQGRDAADGTVNPVGDRSQRVVVEARHLARIDRPVGQ